MPVILKARWGRFYCIWPQACMYTQRQVHYSLASVRLAQDHPNHNIWCPWCNFTYVLNWSLERSLEPDSWPQVEGDNFGFLLNISELGDLFYLWGRICSSLGWKSILTSSYTICSMETPSEAICNIHYRAVAATMASMAIAIPVFVSTKKNFILSAAAHGS